MYLKQAPVSVYTLVAYQSWWLDGSFQADLLKLLVDDHFVFLTKLHISYKKQYMHLTRYFVSVSRTAVRFHEHFYFGTHLVQILVLQNPFAD